MNKTTKTTEQTPRDICTIAREILHDWAQQGKGVNYAAKPYLDAMLSLYSMTDMYMDDSATSIILYFLSNASSYRGETAKRIKAELKAMAGEIRGSSPFILLTNRWKGVIVNHARIQKSLRTAPQ